ncbi:RNA-binding protein 34-like [Wyeomyia smithii]|uniref:RNA-binding protein 34-like n=1 Tax=Wyeomyia smithii TaxID=174621 RepID=UPI002467C968|nr:RNA-binding protein 34-like [Wyeomyia smithii]
MGKVTKTKICEKGGLVNAKEKASLFQQVHKNPKVTYIKKATKKISEGFESATCGLKRSDKTGNPLAKEKGIPQLNHSQKANTKKNTEKSLKLDTDKDVLTSESESDSEVVISNPNELTNLKEKHFRGTEHSVFVGNLPKATKKSAVKQIFKPFGKILTVRFRSLDGEVLLKKKDRETAKALNCYVRFETKEEAQAACTMNGHNFEGHHLRVSLQSQKQLGHHTSTVFVGNIHRDTTDNELYDFFSKVGDIEYVRQISGKYIGYVCFKKGVSIAKALKLNQQLLNGRPLRIMKVDQRHQNTRRNKKGNLLKKNVVATGDMTPGKIDDRMLSKNKSMDGFRGNLAKAKRGPKQVTKTNAERKKKMLAMKLTGNGRGKSKRTLY